MAKLTKAQRSTLASIINSLQVCEMDKRDAKAEGDHPALLEHLMREEALSWRLFEEFGIVLPLIEFRLTQGEKTDAA